MTMAVFPSSASRSGLMAAADVAEPTFTHAVQQLLDLSLIEAEQPTDDITAMGHKARLATHPLTRTFVSTLLAARPEAAQAAYERWLEWCCACAAASGGYVLSDMGRLAALDMDEPTLFAAVEWAFDHGRDHEVIALVKNLEFYYYVRALWGKKLALHRWYIVAANRLDDANEEIYALALHIQLLSRQGNWGEAAQYLSRLDELIQEQPLRGALAFNYHHTHGLYLLARSEPGQTDLQAAQGHWQWLLDHSEDLDAHMTTGTQHWLGTCLTLQGQVGLARSAFCEALDLANGNGFTRLAARNQLGLALLDIDDGNLEHAEERLAECQALTQLDDWEQRARFDWAHARLSARRGAISAAQAHYDDAITLFVRMGLERERAEAERERNALDTFT